MLLKVDRIVLNTIQNGVKMIKKSMFILDCEECRFFDKTQEAQAGKWDYWCSHYDSPTLDPAKIDGTPFPDWCPLEDYDAKNT